MYRAMTGIDYISKNSGKYVHVEAGEDFDDMNDVGLGYELAAGTVRALNEDGHPVDSEGNEIPVGALATPGLFTSTGKGPSGRTETSVVLPTTESVEVAEEPTEPEKTEGGA